MGDCLDLIALCWHVPHNLALEQSVAVNAESASIKNLPKHWVTSVATKLFDRWAAVLTCHYINGYCLYGIWLKARCQITSRISCCALTLKSVKTDFAVFAWLSLKSAMFVETERLLCWHLWCSSTVRSGSCWKSDIYAVRLGFFKLRWHSEASLHWTHRSCTMRWRLWQLLTVSLYMATGRV